MLTSAFRSEKGGRTRQERTLPRPVPAEATPVPAFPQNLPCSLRSCRQPPPPAKLTSSIQRRLAPKLTTSLTHYCYAPFSCLFFSHGNLGGRVR